MAAEIECWLWKFYQFPFKAEKLLTKCVVLYQTILNIFVLILQRVKMLQNNVIFCKFISPDCEMNPISQRVSLLRMTLLSLKIYSLEYWFIPFIFATSISVGALWLLFRKTRHGLGQEYFKLEILVSSPRIVFYTLLKCIKFLVLCWINKIRPILLFHWAH